MASQQRNQLGCAALVAVLAAGLLLVCSGALTPAPLPTDAAGPPRVDMTRLGDPAHAAIYAAVDKALGRGPDGHSRIYDFTVFDDVAKPKLRRVGIGFDAAENLTAGLARNGMYMDALNVIAAIKQAHQPAAIAIRIRMPMRDGYGNPATEEVLKLHISAATVARINPSDPSVYERLPRLADTHWLHPAFNR